MGSTSQGAARVTVAPEIMAHYEAVIGLEVHAQLKTLTKAFCGCSTRFGDAPNSQYLSCVPGIAGSAAGAESRRVELAHARGAGVALRRAGAFALSRARIISIPTCRRATKFRMYELPLATKGWLEIEAGGATKRIGITRAAHGRGRSAKIYTKASRIPTAGATLTTTAAACR